MSYKQKMLINRYLMTVGTSSLSNANKARIFKSFHQSASITVAINDKIYGGTTEIQALPQYIGTILQY